MFSREFIALNLDFARQVSYTFFKGVGRQPTN